MLNVNFNLKCVKHNNERPINMVLRWNNKKLVYATQEKIDPKYFETTRGKKFSQRVNSTYRGFTEFNTRLDGIESITNTTFRKFLNDNNRIPEPQELKKVLNVRLRNGQKNNKHTLFQFIDSFIEEAEKNKINRENGKKITLDTSRMYRRGLTRLKEFASNYNRKIDFDTIDLEFYDKYVEFLSVGLQLSNNTVGRYVKTLKLFLNEPTDREFNTNLAFRNKRFKVLRESVYKIYLDESELRDLFSLDLSNHKKLERVRDLFLVGCWTGHKSEKVFLSYLKATAEENANILQNHWSKKEQQLEPMPNSEIGQLEKYKLHQEPSSV